MRLQHAREILRCYRPSGADEEDREFRDALAAVKKNAAAEAEFRDRLAFDRAAAAAITPEVPSDVREELVTYTSAFAKKPPAARLALSDPAIIAVSLGLLALIALGVWLFLARLEGVSGKDEAVELARRGDAQTAAEFEPVDSEVGTLADWFLLKGFEGFAVPKPFPRSKAVGVRIFEFKTEPVAAMAVTENRMFFYVFRGPAIGIEVSPERQWKVIQYAEKPPRSLALWQEKDISFMLTMKGTKAEVEDMIRKAIDRL